MDFFVLNGRGTIFSFSFKNPPLHESRQTKMYIFLFSKKNCIEYKHLTPFVNKKIKPLIKTGNVLERAFLKSKRGET